MADTSSFLAYYDEIRDELAGSAPPWIREIQDKARSQFEAQGFPTLKDEQWRFTRVRPLLQHDFRLEPAYQPNGLDAAELEQLAFADGDCRRLVFVNGAYAADLSAPGDLPEGLWLGRLRDAIGETPERLRNHLAKYADPASNPFVALNTAHLVDGAAVLIPEDVEVQEPIHLVFLSSPRDGNIVSYPRNLIVAGAGSKAKIIESYVGKGDGVYFTNAVTEAVIERGADIDHYKLQKENMSAYHFGTISAQMAESSTFDTLSVTLGGTLVRNDINTFLAGEDIHSTMDGLYLAGGHQHVDNHTQIDHAMPNCNSFEVFKGILDDRASAVFNGKIHVHPDAQKTDAKQSNGCMLLSDDARINTNPQLEIYADDVKCTHGAVVGQIDEEAIFYLRSRGIPNVEARHILVYAFASELLEKVSVPALRERLERDLFEWLGRQGR